MKKLNCWEFMKCDKGLTDNDNGKSGSCPVASEIFANDLNGGTNGGRICWVIMDRHCKKKAQTTCFQCEFHYKVMSEEGLINNCNAIGSYLGKTKKKS
ncbi:MAG: two-CW domain-containing protein [Promethearchaeota archaeon]